MHRLGGFAFTAVRDTPDVSFGAVSHPGAVVPKIRGLGMIKRVFVGLAEAAVFYLPGDLRAELKIQPQVVNTPAFIGAQIQTVFGIGDKLFEAGFAGLQINIGHAD